MQTGVFEGGLLPDLFELQRIGQYCKSMQEAVGRAQRSAASMEAVDGTVSAMWWSTVARGRPRTQMRAVRIAESRRERKRSRVPVGTKVQQQHPSRRSCLYQSPYPSPLPKLVTIHPAR